MIAALLLPIPIAALPLLMMLFSSAGPSVSENTAFLPVSESTTIAVSRWQDGLLGHSQSLSFHEDHGCGDSASAETGL
ncbi:hypothetical protein AYO38_02215 [bacterium SCGC AG-212-C10]|nr:hypothetical protein AYO38_02215 [bacterium SCGC AG-212-C10]